MATTTYLGLLIQVPGVTAGTGWATGLEANEVLIDAHDHTSGKGKLVPTAGLGIDGDLTFGGYSATSLKTTRYANQSALLATVDDIRCVYVEGENLYFRNSAGTNVQITSGGTLLTPAIASVFTPHATAADETIGANQAEIVWSVDAAGGNRSYTLPAANAVTAGRFYIFSDRLGNCGIAGRQITINAGIGDTIDGAPFTTITTMYASIMVVSDGTSKWKAYRWLFPSSASVAGNVLQYSAAGGNTWGPVNLAGGAAYVTGSLPGTNVQDASTSNKGVVQLGGDLAGTGTAAATPKISTLSGLGGTTSVACANLQWSNTVNTPFLGHQAKGSSAAGTDFTIFAQDANTAGLGGSLILCSGDKAGGNVPGRVELSVGGIGGHKTPMVEVTDLVGDYAPVVGLCAGAVLTTTQLPANTGRRVVYLANRATAPTAAPVGGLVFFGEGGDFAFRTSSNHTFVVSATTGTTATAGNAGPTVPAACAKWLQVTWDGTNYKLPLFEFNGAI